jgi:tetratricopeptide (TPR) repeat protein
MQKIQRALTIAIIIILLVNVSCISTVKNNELKHAQNDKSEVEQLGQKVIQLYEQAAYSDAIPIAQKVLDINEKVLGPDHPSVAQSLNNLALLYYSLGDYAKAEPLNKRSLAIREKVLGPDHPDVAQSLNNLAGLYSNLGDYTMGAQLNRYAVVPALTYQSLLIYSSRFIFSPVVCQKQIKDKKYENLILNDCYSQLKV